MKMKQAGTLQTGQSEHHHVILLFLEL